MRHAAEVITGNPAALQVRVLMIMMILMIMRVLMTMMVMIVIMVIRVGQFQVCVSDFFHLLNFGVCYRGKMRKNFKFFWNTPDPGTLSHLAGEQIYK